MKGYKLIVPLASADLPAHCDFMDWLKLLEDGGICAQVFRNSTMDTAMMLEKAHGLNSVTVLDILHTDTYLIGAVDHMMKVMAEVQKNIQLRPERYVVCIERTNRS